MTTAKENKIEGISSKGFCADTTIQVTYSEDSNVVMMVTRGASQLRGSESFQDK